MVPNTSKLASWIALLCMLVQAAAASSGGILCIGCLDVRSGVRFTSAACTPEADCCDAPAEGHVASDESRQNHRGAHAPMDCGCVDLDLAPHGSHVAIRPAKPVERHSVEQHAVAALPHAYLCVVPRPPDATTATGPPGGAAAHLRSPLSRRTVLRI